jgi:hypothetical protein
MRFLVSILIVSGVFLNGCLFPKSAFKTVPADNPDPNLSSGVIYGLPQTVLRITVGMTEVKTYRGPYYRFAEKYLGIEGVPAEDKTEWFVNEIDVVSHEEADPGHYYMIQPVKGKVSYDRLLDMMAEGLIIDMTKLYHSVGFHYQGGQQKEPGVIYTDLSVKRNIELSTDTLYKTILTDTSFIKVPVLKKQLISKTIDEKAEEAANFIIKTRKRRFKLMAGQYDFYPSGPALEFGVKRLDEIEQEYLSLFIGKKIRFEHSFVFYYIPKEEEIFENVELLEYSGSGVSHEITGDGRVVSLLISNVNKTGRLDAPGAQAAHDSLNTVFYRIRDMAEMEIRDGGKTLMKQRFPVSQYGTILALPVH